MAKKASGRYQTPGQVAKELEQFADDAQLRALVEQPATPSDLGKGSGASARARRRWYRRREFLVSAAGGLAAAVAFPIIYSLTRNSAFWQPDPEDSVNLDFVTLVGLTGRWWFDEIPCLIPEFRASSARFRFHAVREPTPGGARRQKRPLLDRDVAKVHEQLRDTFQAYLEDLGAKDLQRSGLIHDVLWDLSRSGLSEEELKSVVDNARKLDDPHLLGLVQHKLDQPDADVSYKKAIERYTSEINKGEGGADVHRALLALCYSDLAAWQFKQNKYADAVKNFQHVRQTLGARDLDAPLLEAASLCGEVLGLRRLARTRADWEVADQRMSRAFRIAEEHLDELHPLRAYLHERRAWTLMDQWRLSEAKDDFEEAIRLHQAALGMKSAPARPEHKTLARIFHNMHGLAMTDRFAGRLDDAHQSYAVVLEDVSAQLDKPEAQRDQELTERLVNTAERLGDLWLFRANPEPEDAQSYYDAAFGYASEISGTTVTSGDPDRDTVQARILLKRTIALILAERPEETARELDELKRILAPYEAAPYSEGKLYADSAHGLILLAGGREGSVEGRKKLRVVLQTVLQDADSPSTGSSAQYGLRRDTFELLLFVWARLLDSEYPESLPEVEPEELLDDIDTVFRIRPEVLPDPALLSYLKPHYDLAVKAEIELSEQADPGTIVRHVAMANKTSGFVAVRLLRKPILCFYFFRQEQDGGYALLFEPGKPLYKSRLELSEAGIAALVSSQTKLALPQELLDRLRQCEQPVVIDWKTDEFFPFECPPNAEIAAADDRVRGG
jgi:tetratricopeptide (TPR) repeat protein